MSRCLFLLMSLAAVPLIASDAKITGTVTYLQRMAMPADAEIEVQLADVSRADAPATVLSLRRIKPTGQVPIPFELVYDGGLIKENMEYAVSARMFTAGRLVMMTDTRYSVITRGRPTQVELVLKGVVRPASVPKPQ